MVRHAEGQAVQSEKLALQRPELPFIAGQIMPAAPLTYTLGVDIVLSNN